MKILPALSVLLVCTLLLPGCEKPVRQESRKAQFEVLSMRRPHSGKQGRSFLVSVRNTQTQQVYQRVRVARRCRNWRALKIGSRHELTEVVSYYKDGHVRTHLTGTKVLCPPRS